MKDKELKFPHDGSVDSDELVEQLALEHYENAIKMEAQGKIKVSLELYKKALKVSRIVSWHRLRPKLINI